MEDFVAPVPSRTDLADLRGLVDGIDAVVYEVDLNGWCRFVNRRAVELFGYPQERWLSQPHFSHAIALSADRPLVMAHFCDCAGFGTRHQFEYRAVAADGRVVWISETLTAARTAAGEVGLLRGVMRRIGRPRKARRRLLLARRKLGEQLADMTLLHEISQRLWATPDLEPLLEEIVEALVSIHGAEMGIARVYDPVRRDLRVVASVGLPQEYLGRYGCIPLGDLACGLAIERGSPVIIEDVDAEASSFPYQGPARIGGYRAKYSTLMVSRSGELLGTLATCFREPHQPTKREIRLVELFACQAADFVENAQLKLALGQADERKNRALAALAHELRNPFSAIMSTAQVLRLEASAGSRSADACELIMRQARLMARLADDLIETSRVGTGDAALQLQSVDANVAMAKATAAVNARIQERRHQLVLVPPAHPIRVEADPIRLEQILVNLLINASHYTESGGRITLDAWEEAERVAIRVRDSGEGIAPEMLSRIIEPFVRATNGSRPWLSGLGLGLALVKVFVQRQGGDVTALSDGIGKGSEFVVRLRKAPVHGG